MATVTGNLAQITGSPLTGLEPKIYITIPDNVIYNGVIVTRPAPVTPDSSGNFTVNLIPQVSMRNPQDYGFVIDWLDSAKNFTDMDKPSFTFRVPPEGGTIQSMIVTRPSAFETWIGTTPPPELGNYLWWFNPVTGDFFEWSD